MRGETSMKGRRLGLLIVVEKGREKKEIRVNDNECGERWVE